MPHLVVARQQESLDWIHALPDHCSLTVYNAGEAIDASVFPQQIDVRAVPASTPAMACFLRYLQHGLQASSQEVIVFTPGDPLAHSPAFFDLLAQSDRFADLQVLSAQGCDAHWPPAAVRHADRRDWIDDAPVRAERFSLGSLAPLAYQHDAALRAGKVYRRKHRLADGVPVLAHFFDLAGLPALAQEARQADLGVYAHGGMVAVRRARLQQQLALLRPQLDRLNLLMQADHNYPEVMERAWLHLLGLPFVALEAMAAPAARIRQEDHSGMARVVASIDAVLAASRPIAALKSDAVLSITMPQPTANLAATTAAAPVSTSLLRERAHAAFQRGEANLAWEHLQHALHQSPRDIGLLADATQMAYAQQDTERAMHCARRALAVDPDHVECLFTLAICLAASGQGDEALSLFERLNQPPLAAQWQALHPELGGDVQTALRDLETPADRPAQAA